MAVITSRGSPLPEPFIGDAEAQHKKHLKTLVDRLEVPRGSEAVIIAKAIINLTFAHDEQRRQMYEERADKAAQELAHLLRSEHTKGILWDMFNALRESPDDEVRDATGVAWQMRLQRHEAVIDPLSGMTDQRTALATRSIVTLSLGGSKLDEHLEIDLSPSRENIEPLE